MLRHFRAMADDPRVAAFARAIAETVRPGDVVADVGCGLGTYSVLACRAGASRVYAVEDGPVLEIAREVVRANGCAERVTFLAGHSDLLQPPERARVVLFEDYTLEASTPRIVRTVADLRARWLAPGGAMVPARLRQRLAPVEDAAGRAELDRFADRGESVSGVSLAPTRSRVFAEPFPRRLPAEALLAEPIVVREVAVGDAAPAFSVDAEVIAQRDGTLHGLLLWLELELAGGWHSNAPGAPDSSWSPLEFALDPPLAVRRGRTVRLGLEAAPFGEALLYRWRAETGDAHREACSLDSLPLRAPARAAQVVSPEVVALDREILALVDGKRTLADIAARIEASHPRVGEARVRALLGRYPY